VLIKLQCSAYSKTKRRQDSRPEAKIPKRLKRGDYPRPYRGEEHRHPEQDKHHRDAARCGFDWPRLGQIIVVIHLAHVGAT
jgi:hypothetical protein